MRDERGKFIVSRPIAGIMSAGVKDVIRESEANLHWYMYYTVLFHGHKKDKSRHVSSITENVASVLVF